MRDTDCNMLMYCTACCTANCQMPDLYIFTAAAQSEGDQQLGHPVSTHKFVPACVWRQACS